MQMEWEKWGETDDGWGELHATETLVILQKYFKNLWIQFYAVNISK